MGEREEALLRLLALGFSSEKLKDQVREYLDDFMEFAAEGKFKLSKRYRGTYRKSIRFILMSRSRWPGVRIRNQGLSTNLFDIVATVSLST